MRHFDNCPQETTIENVFSGVRWPPSKRCSSHWNTAYYGIWSSMWFDHFPKIHTYIISAPVVGPIQCCWFAQITSASSRIFCLMNLCGCTMMVAQWTSSLTELSIWNVVSVLHVICSTLNHSHFQYLHVLQYMYLHSPFNQPFDLWGLSFLAIPDAKSVDSSINQSILTHPPIHKRLALNQSYAWAACLVFVPKNDVGTADPSNPM